MHELATYPPKAMSSREIAELTSKNHFHVLRDIRNMLDDLGEDASKFQGRYLDAYKREKACFNLPKDLTLVLLTGYSIKLRAAIIDRWTELETHQANRSPTTLLEALELAIEKERQREALALQNTTSLRPL